MSRAEGMFGMGKNREVTGSGCLSSLREGCRSSKGESLLFFLHSLGLPVFAGGLALPAPASKFRADVYVPS